jgi:hypothetical protein
MSNEWAENITARKVARGELKLSEARQYVDLLFVKVGRTLADNIERWESAYKYENNGNSWTEEKRKKEIEKEHLRLIKLEEGYDDQAQLEYDYAQKGLTVSADHSQAGKIASVKLDFTSAEWADVLNAEGEHLGACCADISRIRDILQDACRNDHEVDVDKLWEAASLAVRAPDP